MRVKVCGITRYEDARLALDCGAWAIGFIFYPPSPRAIHPERAAAILRSLPPDTLAIGVFVDAAAEEVRETVARVGLRGVQLHGRETPEFASGVRADPVIKAFRVGPGFDVGALDAYRSCLALLDAYRPGVPGGTGCSFEWRIAREAGERRPIILAGGLGPDNVAAAVAEARPHGIDVSSGIEARPGQKDPDKVRKLFEALAQSRTNGRS